MICSDDRNIYDTEGDGTLVCYWPAIKPYNHIGITAHSSYSDVKLFDAIVIDWNTNNVSFYATNKIYTTYINGNGYTYYYMIFG